MSVHAEQKKIRRILIVDDDPVSLRYFMACLPKLEYQCTMASSVFEAQSLLEAQGTSSFDCLVTDYLMPDQTGFDLLNWLLQVDVTLASIVVTSGEHKSMLTETLRVGATDFLEKPVSRQVLVDTVAKTCAMTDQRRTLSASHQALQELTHLRDIFLNLDAENTRIHVEPTDVLFFPKYELGGDFVDLFDISSSERLILCGDVSGHDLKAAYVSAYFQGMIYGLAHAGSKLDDSIALFNDVLINRLNKHDQGGGALALFSISAAFISVNEKEDKVRIINCGLPVPYYSDGQGAIKPCLVSSQPLGWFSDIELNSETLSLSGIRKLYIYTDGLPDLADILGINPFSLSYRLYSERKREEQKKLVETSLDDVFMISIGLGVEKDARDCFEPLLVQELLAGTEGLIDHYQAGWERSLIFATANVPLGERLMDILLCCRETVLNALSHGCEGKPNSYCNFQISLNLKHRIIRVRVDDPGEGFDFDINTRMDHLDDLQMYHFGLVMVQSMADKMVFEKRGATIILDFYMGEINI